jgi:hypothetical protein
MHRLGVIDPGVVGPDPAVDHRVQPMVEPLSQIDRTLLGKGVPPRHAPEQFAAPSASVFVLPRTTRRRRLPVTGSEPAFTMASRPWRRSSQRRAPSPQPRRWVLRSRARAGVPGGGAGEPTSCTTRMRSGVRLPLRSPPLRRGFGAVEASGEPQTTAGGASFSTALRRQGRKDLLLE